MYCPFFFFVRTKKWFYSTASDMSKWSSRSPAGALSPRFRIWKQQLRHQSHICLFESCRSHNLSCFQWSSGLRRALKCFSLSQGFHTHNNSLYGGSPQLLCRLRLPFISCSWKTRRVASERIISLQQTLLIRNRADPHFPSSLSHHSDCTECPEMLRWRFNMRPSRVLPLRVKQKHNAICNIDTLQMFSYPWIPRTF